MCVCIPSNLNPESIFLCTTLHHLLSNSLDEQRVIYSCYVHNNSLHKTCMVYRIVYTKLSYSLLSQCSAKGNQYIMFTL